jgi:hypothetical protein
MMGTGALLLVAAIGLAALAIGRLFVGGFGGRLYRRFDPAGAAASLAVGAAVLTLLSITLSAIGLPTADLPPLVAVLLLVPLATCAKRRRLGALRPRGALLEWATLATPLALAAWLAVLPASRAGGFWFGNDTYTYGAFSEWLQRHGYSEAARWEAQSPVTGIPFLYQSQGYDLGIAHLLALVQAAVRPASVLLVYPATSAFALPLVAAMVWLATRQLFRLGVAWAGAAAFVFAAIPHSLYWGHHNGFLQQEYALALVLFGLTVLARCNSRTGWRWGGAVLLALPIAFLVAVYLPLVPLLAAAAVTAFAQASLRARRHGALRRLALFTATVAAGTLVFAGRDVVGALSPLHRFATSVAGGHVPWGAADFLQFALGTRVLAPGWVNVESAPWSIINRGLTPLYVVLVLAGLWVAIRKPRTRPLAGSAVVLLLGAVYFSLLVKDPWSGHVGHTWNLFKLAQWGWPFTLLLGVLAVRRVAPRRPPWRNTVLALAALLPASQVGVHFPWSDAFASAMREVLPGMTMAELPTLKHRIQELPPGTLLVVGRPVNAHRWLGTAVSLLSYPRAVVADWADGASISNHPDGGEALYAQLLERWEDPSVVPIVAGFRPFQTRGVEELGGGFARLIKQDEALIVHVANPSGLGEDDATDRPTFSVGTGRTKIVVFSPSGGPAALALTLQPYRGRPGTRLVAYVAGGDYSHRSVRLASEGPPVATLPLAGETTLRLALELPRGLSTVVLVLDEGRGELDAREPVTVVGLSIQSAGAAAAGG